MSDFQARFGATLEQNISKINGSQAALQSIIPGLHPAHIRRLLNNISNLLGKVDRRQITHPEFLAGTPQSTPERAVELAAGIVPSIEGGPENFTQATLPALVDVETKLIQAVGVGEYKIPQIKNAQVRALDQIIDRANRAQVDATATTEAIEKQLETVSSLVLSTNESAKAAAADSQKVADIRKLADKLAKGNVGQNPLEQSVRTAREKLEEIDKVLANSVSAEAEGVKLSKSSVLKEAEIGEILKRLAQTDDKARSILNTATQAGLAGAYKLEREKLERQQKWFAVGFYGIIASIILYAIIFIIPLISRVFENNPRQIITAAESAFLLVVRIVVIAPAFWALVFTNRRYTNLETLQMDYAAKATTALAYFGYRDEMDEDANLSAKLKDGLIARFIEHPSRLLGKKIESSASIIGPEGAKVITESHSPGIDASIKLNAADILGG